MPGTAGLCLLLGPAEMQVRNQENQHFCFAEDFEPFFPLMKYMLSPLFSLQYLLCIQQVFETSQVNLADFSFFFTTK